MNTKGTWTFKFTEEQVSTLMHVLSHTARKLNDGSASGDVFGLAKRISHARVVDLMDEILAITG